VIAPDSEFVASSQKRGRATVFRKHRRRIAQGIVFPLLCAVLYLALKPNYDGGGLPFVPRPIHRWISEHDDFDNIVVFAVFAFVTLLARTHPSGADNASVSGAFARLFASQGARLVGLLSMVCLFETLQKWIPGRVSSLRDVCTGWSGIFAAWLLTELLDARAKNATATAQARGLTPRNPRKCTSGP
jgi:hypothetical protein